MNARCARYTILLVFLPLLLLGGCLGTTAPTRFFLLTALSDTERLEGRAGAGGQLVIGVGPVELPRYLDRPQIATRAGQHELRLAEFDQWAEPLQDNVTRVLAENLSRLLAADDVVIHPWPRSAHVAYQVLVQVTRFDSTIGAQSMLTARWQIIDVQEDRELLRKTSSFAVPIEASDYGAIVAAMSRGLGDLSREIAGEMRALAQN
jgi:uncharacterized lipoprotein YmbA